ncbi:RNA polymerase Rpb2, domain 7 [Penicillium digitatum]|uniref:RNA polymerase Rpb2, domain 7 n=1 Tax=Penicillium digitatum TaxID=36651 RepID=A0A7T7BL16_PENDI|nr:RNA polymerase Rpb2, domain 7 [Penicillium digitatum]
MPASFSTLRRRERQWAATYLQARSKVITAIDVIYKRVEIYSSAQIDPASYKSLGIDCQLLELDDDGKHLQPSNSDPSAPIFFEPRGVTWVAPVRITDVECEEEFKEITDGWESAKDDPLVQSFHSQVCGSIIPSIFAERFYSAIWCSMRWLPVSAFVPKKLLYPAGKPHTLIVILIEDEPGEELFRAEVMILAAAMITRLEGEECLEYNTIPVMAITIFGRMQARVLEAHSNQQELVVKKTQLLDFSTNEVANKNMDILLGFMAGDLVGDPRGPTVPMDTSTVGLSYIFDRLGKHADHK